MKAVTLFSLLSGLAILASVPEASYAVPIASSKASIVHTDPLIEPAAMRGGGRAYRGGGAVRRGGAVVGPRGGVAMRRTTVVRPGWGGGGVRRTTVVRPGYRGGGVRWARPGRYWWRPGGAIAAGAAIGFVSAATAAAWAGAAPAPNMCWYYSDPSRTTGFWDQCP
jgi:hypothetical protein